LSANFAALERGPSLDLKTFLKKGIADRRSLGRSQSAERHPLPMRWKGGGRRRIYECLCGRRDEVSRGKGRNSEQEDTTGGGAGAVVVYRS
jgi:hypothetical protein